MRKRILTLLTALLSMGLYAQVGINTEDPKASLDIVASTASPTANGLLVPRLTADEVQTMETQVGDDQNALLVYVTATFTASPTDTRYTDIDAIGYYYYDAKDNAPNGKWKKLGSATYTAGAGIEISGKVVSATGLERRVVTSTYGDDYYAWSLIGRDKQAYKNSGFGKPKYLPLGLGAVDLSHGQEGKGFSPTGASGELSFASGEATTASGSYSTAMGYETIASGNQSTAMGQWTTASGWASTAMGHNTTASGTASTAMGWSTRASGSYSTAMGEETTASGHISTAMGYRTTASSMATAMGNGTTASGYISTAMGYRTTASGKYSTAMGESTTASGWASTAMGYNTTASGTASTVMGLYTTASGSYSTAMGEYTTASGTASTAMGEYTTASGMNSVAMGLRTTAPYENSTAMGTYNATPTNALLMVGNGRYVYPNHIYQNALTIYKDGTIEAKAIADTDGSTATKVVVVDSSGKLKSINKTTLGGNYTAGTGINISGNTISGNYTGSNGVRVSGNTISGNYTGSNGVRVSGNTISGNYQGQNGITISGNRIGIATAEKNKIDEIDNLKRQLAELQKTRLVNNIDNINKRSDRTRITGTVGYWYKNGNNWYYKGEVYIIAAVGNSNQWLYVANGMVFKLNMGYNTDTKGNIETTGTLITSLDTVIEVSREWDTSINGNPNSTTLSGIGIRAQWRKGNSEVQSAYLSVSGTNQSAQFLVRPVLQRWYYDE